MSNLSVTYTGSGTPYAIIRKASDSTVWNGSALVAFVNADISNYDIALTNDGGDLWTGDFPDDIEAGGYSVMYYRRTGGSPTTSDLLLFTEDVTWNGSTADPGLPDGDAEGRYIDQATLTAFLGSLNLSIQSQQNPEATTVDPANVQRAVDYAESAVESELAIIFKLTTDVGLTWGAVALLASGSRSLALIREACHQLAAWRLNKWRAVQSLGNDGSVTQSVVDGIASAMESDAKAALADWRANPEKLYEVDRIAATGTSAMQTAGGITAKTGDAKWYPGTRGYCYVG